MKVIYILKNSLIQEFQHSLESKLIEVMSHKMSQIQFASKVNWIQTQSTQVAHVLSSCSTGQLADASSEK
jgi:CRP-like cAMP-binding protein